MVMSSDIRPGVKPVPAVVDQVTMPSKAALCLQLARSVQRLKQAPNLLSRQTLGGNERIR
jgi:hypothetical protein